MRNLLFALPLMLMVGCSPASTNTAVAVAVDGTACLMAADAVASDADTLANAQAVAVVLATNPACKGLASATLAAIQAEEGPAPAPVVTAPVTTPVTAPVAPATK